jgi:hypothetical protein
VSSEKAAEIVKEVKGASDSNDNIDIRKLSGES